MPSVDHSECLVGSSETSKTVTQTDGCCQQNSFLDELEQKLAETREMKENLFKMKKEMQIQMDFIRSNMQVLHQTIHAQADSNTVYAPIESHRHIVNDFLNMHKIFKAESDAANVVSKACNHFEEETSSRIQQLQDLEWNISNMKNNLAVIDSSLNRAG